MSPERPAAFPDTAVAPSATAVPFCERYSLAVAPPQPAAAIDPANLDPDALGFGFMGGRLLVEVAGDRIRVPVVRDMPTPLAAVSLGELGGRQSVALVYEKESDPPPHLAAMGLRELFDRLDPAFSARAGRASQVIEWFIGHAYCGRCGTPTRPSAKELARNCDSCGMPHYPRVTPAVIMLVEREGSMLLARSAQFRAPFYSALAGFVEPGETLEEAVAREVAEEVGLDVGAITYFGSQPWPFPSQLMIGFTAVYAAGDIELRDSEIVDAKWFAPTDEMPLLPGRFSIARRLVDSFLSRAGVSPQQ